MNNTKAYDEKGKPYSGIYRVKSSNGDEFDIKYDKGELVASCKNSLPYKSYHKFDESFLNFYAAFSDGYNIPFSYLWHIDENSLRTIVCHENNTKHYIAKNTNNPYQVMPCAFMHIAIDNKNNKLLNANTITLDNRDCVYFSSIEEAKEYFSNEYGINADFQIYFKLIF